MNLTIEDGCRARMASRFPIGRSILRGRRASAECLLEADDTGILIRHCLLFEPLAISWPQIAALVVEEPPHVSATRVGGQSDDMFPIDRPKGSFHPIGEARSFHGPDVGLLLLSTAGLPINTLVTLHEPIDLVALAPVGATVRGWSGYMYTSPVRAANVSPTAIGTRVRGADELAAVAAERGVRARVTCRDRALAGSYPHPPFVD